MHLPVEGQRNVSPPQIEQRAQEGVARFDLGEEPVVPHQPEGLGGLPELALVGIGLEHGVEHGGRRVAEAIRKKHRVEELRCGVLGSGDQQLAEDGLGGLETAGFGEDVEDDGLGVEGVGGGGAVEEGPAVELEGEDRVAAKAEEEVRGAEGREGGGEGDEGGPIGA